MGRQQGLFVSQSGQSCCAELLLLILRCQQAGSNSARDTHSYWSATLAVFVSFFRLIRIKTVGGSWKPSMEAKLLWTHWSFVWLSLPALKSKNFIKLQWRSHMPFQRGCCKYNMLVNHSVVLGICSSLIPVPRAFAFWVTEDCFVVYIHFATGNCSSLSSSWILRILWCCVSPESFECLDAVLNSCGGCFSFLLILFCFLYFGLWDLWFHWLRLATWDLTTAYTNLGLHKIWTIAFICNCDSSWCCKSLFILWKVLSWWEGCNIV